MFDEFNHAKDSLEVLQSKSGTDLVDSRGTDYGDDDGGREGAPAQTAFRVMMPKKAPLGAHHVQHIIQRLLVVHPEILQVNKVRVA